jgi:hypothetical protein
MTGEYADPDDKPHPLLSGVRVFSIPLATNSRGHVGRGQRLIGLVEDVLAAAGNLPDDHGMSVLYRQAQALTIQENEAEKRIVVGTEWRHGIFDYEGFEVSVPFLTLSPDCLARLQTKNPLTAEYVGREGGNEFITTAQDILLVWKLTFGSMQGRAVAMEEDGCTTLPPLFCTHYRELLSFVRDKSRTKAEEVILRMPAPILDALASVPLDTQL